MKKRKKYPGRWALLGLVLLLGVLTADSNLRLVTTEYEIASPKIPAAFDGFRVLQLSDIHGAVFGRGNRRLLALAESAVPDLIVLTGDLADEGTELADTETLLAGLTAIAPVCYVSGNHEWSEGMLEPLTELFARFGVRYFRNEWELLSENGASIVLAGVEDPNGWKDMMTPPELAEQIRAEYPEAFVLLLGHRNDWISRYPNLPVDLILCGHAHGGIIRLPGLGGLLGTDRSLFPDYTEGLYESGAYQLVISRGIGRGNPIPRFLNNPEAVQIVLRSEKK